MGFKNEEEVLKAIELLREKLMSDYEQLRNEQEGDEQINNRLKSALAEIEQLREQISSEDVAEACSEVLYWMTTLRELDKSFIEEVVDDLETIFKQYQHKEAVKECYVGVLTKLLRVQASYDKETTLKKLESLDISDSNNDFILEQYASALSCYLEDGEIKEDVDNENIDSCKENLEKCKKLYERCREGCSEGTTNYVASEYAKALFYLARRKKVTISETIKEIKQLEDTTKDKDVARWYGRLLEEKILDEQSSSYDKKENIKTFEEDKDTRKLECLLHQYDDDKVILECYVRVLSNKIKVVNNLSQREKDRVLNVIEVLNHSYKGEEAIIEAYAEILCNSVIKQPRKYIENTTMQLEKFFNKHSKNRVVMKQYIKLLFELFSKQKQDRVEYQSTVSKIESLYRLYGDDTEVSECFIETLANLLSVPSEVKMVVNELETLYGLYEEGVISEFIIDPFAHSLRVFIEEENNFDYAQDSFKKLEELYEKHRDRNEVVEEYVKSLVFLVKNLKQDMKSKIKDVYIEHKNNLIVKQSYVDSIVHHALHVDEKQEIEAALDEIINIFDEERVEDVTIGDTELLLPSYVNYSSSNEPKGKLKKLHISEENYNPLLVQIYKKILVRMIIKADKESDEDEQIKELFDDLSKIGSRKEALEYYLESIGIKDSIPENLPKSVSECHILRIANNVKFIKDTLRLKSLPDKTSIVHYTSLHNTKFFIPMDQGEPSKAKLKLYNVAYMNDPEEGRVLNRFLDRKHKTKGLLLNDQAQINSVYLFSLSLKEDYLPMWTQYGKNGSGVCIYFKNDNFEIGRHSSNDYLKILQEEIKDENKLPLYRVCYLDCEKKKNSTVFVDGIDSKDKIQIKCSLNKIENAIEGLKKEGLIKKERLKKGDIENLDWIDFINNIINEIRYLFKSVSYEHEREIRLMKYFPNELNDKVKLENREGSDIRLYFEYSQPILIRKIIFGPKAEGTEVLKPYIKYCDPEIDVEHSKIKYR